MGLDVSIVDLMNGICGDVDGGGMWNLDRMMGWIRRGEFGEVGHPFVVGSSSAAG